MKLQTTLLALVLTLSVNAQEWISDSECKSESAKIISQYKNLQIYFPGVHRMKSIL